MLLNFVIIALSLIIFFCVVDESGLVYAVDHKPGYVHVITPPGYKPPPRVSELTLATNGVSKAASTHVTSAAGVIFTLCCAYVRVIDSVMLILCIRVRKSVTAVYSSIRKYFWYLTLTNPFPAPATTNSNGIQPPPLVTKQSHTPGLIGSGVLSRPHSVAAGCNEVYVIDIHPDRVSIFDANTHSLKRELRGLSNPLGITVDPAGNVIKCVDMSTLFVLLPCTSSIHRYGVLVFARTRWRENIAAQKK